MRAWLGLALIGLAVCGCTNDVESSAQQASGGTASGGRASSGGVSNSGGVPGIGGASSTGGSATLQFDFDHWECPGQLDGTITGDAKYGVGPHTTFELEVETLPPHPVKLVQLRNDVCPDAAAGGAGGGGGMGGFAGPNRGGRTSYLELQQLEFVQGAGEVNGAQFTVTEAPARLSFYPTDDGDYVIRTEPQTDPEMHQGVVALVDVETHEVLRVYAFVGRLWLLLL